MHTIHSKWRKPNTSRSNKKIAANKAKSHAYWKKGEDRTVQETEDEENESSENENNDTTKQASTTERKLPFFKNLKVLVILSLISII